MTRVALGNFFFRYRELLVPLLFVLLFLPGPPVAREPITMLAIGAGLALTGQLVRALTIGLKYIVRGGRNRQVYADDLVTEGIYAHTRNPMYLGNLLILAGVALASNSWICLLVAMALGILAYTTIVASEESFLRGKFREAYDAYARAVPRWSVRFRGLAATLRAGEFHWRRLLVKEYGTTAAWLAAISVTGLVAAGTPDGTAGDWYLRVTLILCAGIAVVFGFCVKWLKTSGIVVAD